MSAPEAPPAGSPPLSPPQWDQTDRHGYLRGLRLLIQKLNGLFLRFVVFRGNKAAYLRHLGARIGPECEILAEVSAFGTEPWLIEIGRRVTITHGVTFLTHDGASRLFRQRLPGSSPWGNRFGTIWIGDNSFVGANALLMPGIRIGPDSIVGAGSLVTHDVPPNTVVGGVPARVLCSLDEYIARYQQKWVPVTAADRQALRRELTRQLWGEER